MKIKRMQVTDDPWGSRRLLDVVLEIGPDCVLIVHSTNYSDGDWVSVYVNRRCVAHYVVSDTWVVSQPPSSGDNLDKMMDYLVTEVVD